MTMKAKLSHSTTHLAILILVTCLVYANSLSVPFIFDDHTSIVNNPAVRDFRIMTDSDLLDNAPMLPDLRNSIKTRTVSYLTLAGNYSLNGLHPKGYHLVNTLIHVSTVCLVYLMVVRLMLLARSPDIDSGVTLTGARWLALITALLYGVHPVHTSAVTYITQRFTSLVALFYLLAIVTYLKARSAEVKRTALVWYLACFVVTVLAMDTKETAFTIPLMLTIIDYLFLAGETRQRLKFLLPMYLTMFIIPLTLWTIVLTDKGVTPYLLEATGLMNLDNIPRASYLFTQFRVIITYFRILLWPANLNLDYDYPIFHSFFAPPVMISCAVLVLFFAAGIYLLYRARQANEQYRANYKVGAFGIFWFFLTISMTSSVIPINDVINEYRLYLPSIGFILLLVCLGDTLWQSVLLSRPRVYLGGMKLILVGIASALALTTMARNLVWQNRLGFWQDVASKSPGKPRPVHILSNIYLEHNMPDKAIAVLLELIRRNPTLGKPHVYLGNVYLPLGRYKEALEEFNKALAVRKDKAEIHLGLAQAYLGLGETAKAREALAMVSKLEPTNPVVPEIQVSFLQQDKN